MANEFCWKNNVNDEVMHHSTDNDIALEKHETVLFSE